MNRILIALFLVSALLQGCTSQQEIIPPRPFTEFKEAFMLDYWQAFPAHASSAGYRDYDTVLVLPGPDSRAAATEFARRYLDSLSRYVPDSLPMPERIDLRLIENRMQAILFETDTLQEWRWNAASYNVGPVMGLMLKGRYAPLDERLSTLYHRSRHIPKYYAAAAAQIQEPTHEHLVMGILQNQGTLRMLQGELRDSINNSTLPDSIKEEFLHRLAHADEAVEGYIAHLTALKDGDGPFRSFRLGDELFARKFHYNLGAGWSADEIFNYALDQKNEAHTEMLRLTQKLYPKYFGASPGSYGLPEVQRLIDHLSNDHPTPEAFMGVIKDQLQELEAFVVEKDLITLDPNKPLIVRETPGYLQGIALFSISAPGPYDKHGDTYYNVNDLSKLPREQALSYLREYNSRMLQILNIHEAIPGHYTQLVYANESPSIIKSIFRNTTMIEGWACYTERMMLEEGYGDHEPELWLMYWKWYLRVLGNTLIDIGVHTRDWNQEQVMDFLVNEAFQEQSEAEGKWMRVQRSSVQLCSYFTGFTEILSLREEMKSKQGAAFDLKAFHEAFLSYGSAPVKFIREAMLLMFEV